VQDQELALEAQDNHHTHHMEEGAVPYTYTRKEPFTEQLGTIFIKECKLKPDSGEQITGL